MTAQLTSKPEPLVLELLHWVDARPRTYDATIEAWRTFCPRAPVWEDALERGLIRIAHAPGVRMTDTPVQLTSSGRAALESRRAAR